MSTQRVGAAFSGLVDLASERLGGKALDVSDDFFAEKENLLKPEPAIFIADKYTDRGKWMDGWESRRKRVPGHDWCVIRLGLGGVIHGVDIDTSHFLGNHPPYASLEACALEPGEDESVLEDGERWTEILGRSPLAPGSQNLFGVSSEKSWTHVKLHIYPDGGVARLRVYGEVTPQVAEDGEVDLVALENGGKALACSDMFFSHMTNLIMPGRGKNMGDGWESRRRRGPGHDWVILKTGRAGVIERLEVDTNHFKGNYPDRCTVEGCYAPGEEIDLLNWNRFEWVPVLEEQKLSAHKQHFFKEEIKGTGPVTHVRLSIYPDGGVSRFRVYGRFEK